MTNSYPINWFKYDLCIKCPYNQENNDISPEIVEFINGLSKIIGPHYIYGYVSEYDQQFTILIRAGSKFLYQKAIQESWELLLDPEICNLLAIQGNPDYFIQPFFIPHNPRVSSIPPFQYIYAPYVKDSLLRNLYYCKFGKDSPFDKNLRLKMLMTLLKSTQISKISREMKSKQSGKRGNERNITDENEQNESTHELDLTDNHIDEEVERNDTLGKGLMNQDQTIHSLKNLLDNHFINDIFAIHDLPALSDLSNRIFTANFNKWFELPIDLIKDYYGERIAFNIAFFDYLGKSQLVISLIGIAFQVLAIYYNNFKSLPEFPPFAFFIPIYSIIIVQRWKKIQQIFAMKWNCQNQQRIMDLNSTFENGEVRSDFYGKVILSPINGEELIYFSHSVLNRCRYFFGWMLSIFSFVVALVGVLVSMSGIYYARYQLSKFDSLMPYVQYIASGGTGLIIILYSLVFNYIAPIMTMFENHRTDKSFNLSLSCNITPSRP